MSFRIFHVIDMTHTTCLCKQLGALVLHSSYSHGRMAKQSRNCSRCRFDLVSFLMFLCIKFAKSSSILPPHGLNWQHELATMDFDDKFRFPYSNKVSHCFFGIILSDL